MRRSSHEPGWDLQEADIDQSWSCTVTRAGDICTVTLSGELDLLARDALGDVLLSEVDRPGTVAVHIDLGAVDFLDSSGMSAIAGAYSAAQAAGRRLVLVRTSRRARKVLEITGLLPLLSGHPDQSEAERSA